MLNKDTIKLMYQDGYGYSTIAKEYAVSRQRIHQIVKNYKKYGRHGRLKKYRQLFDLCEKCQKLAVALHHRDRNNANDSLKNLMPVCKGCHNKLHTLKEWARKYPACLNCKTVKNSYYSHGLCSKCYFAIHKLPKTNKCLNCKKDILDISKRCNQCNIKQILFKKYAQLPT